MKIEPTLKQLLADESKAFAFLATLMPDGSPQVTPVWFSYDGEYIWVNSAKGRVKDKNMRRDPRVALAIVDPSNMYQYMQIQGEVIEVTEEGAQEHINSLAKKYLGQDVFNGAPGEIRVKYKIRIK